MLLVFTYRKEVRNAAGMPTTSVIDLDYIRVERRRELAFEDHRFWDIRRWKIGEVVEEIYGVSISNDDNQISYKRKKIQDRIWDDKMYLYAIPVNETFINSELTQNPGW